MADGPATTVQRVRSTGADASPTGYDPRSARPSDLPGRVRWSRRAYQVLAWAFVACVAAQVFLAGLGVFVSPIRWTWHETFVHLFEYLPLLMLVLAFTGRLSHRLRWLTALSFVLIGLQYAFIEIGRDTGVGEIAALHPVNGLLIFWLAVTLARGAAK